LHRSTSQPEEFRRRVGHVFPLETLLSEQSSTQERKLYEALVSLEEGADLADYMAARKNGSTRDRLLTESKQLREHAAIPREILEKRRSPAIPEMLEEQSANIPID
jgi:hypothetical protein